MTRLAAFLLYVAIPGALLVVVMGLAPGDQIKVSGLLVGAAFVAAGLGYAGLAWLEGTGRGLLPRPSVGVGARTSASARQAMVFVLLVAILGSMILAAGPTFKFAGSELRSITWRLWDWYIEDAAISFAYARNWAMGDGLVAFPGSERIEGYSNPTWVALMALWYTVGVDGFWSSKLMAMAMGGATVVITWLAARELLEDDDGPAALIAPLALGFMPTFAFWNASGLENPIVNLCLAGGIWRVLVESRRGGYPWSAVWFVVLACSRPEAIMYGAWGGFVAMVAAVLSGRGLRSTGLWLLTFFVPFGIYQFVRYEYFAWAFPNTYYAKLGSKEFKPFAWMARGWKYIRGWSDDTGTGWFLGVFLAGLIGTRGLRIVAVVVGGLVIGGLFLYPNAEITAGWSWWPTDLPNPTWWNEVRVWLLLGTALALPIASLSDRRAVGRVLPWGMILITLFFCVRSGGDWMKGYRWMSFVMVPGALLFAAGVEELAALAQRVFARTGSSTWTTPGWLVATVAVVGVMPGWFAHAESFYAKREVAPESVRVRADYTAWVVDRLRVLDRHVYNLDVDMGAHVYWSPHEMVDMAGLVDVAIAHHDFKQRAFTQEYVFKDRKPFVAHVHGSWATTSRVPTFSEWTRDYVELPNFAASARGVHPGNHVRRDLMFAPAWTGVPGRNVHFDKGIALVGFDVPSPEVSVGKSLYLEVGLGYRRLQDKEDFRVLGFLADDEGHLSSFDVPVGYDWVPPTEWHVDEVNVVRIAPLLPRDLPPGIYDLGFVVIGADGAVVEVARREGYTGKGPAPFIAIPDRAVIGGYGDVPARFMVGEVRFPDVVRIGPAGTGESAAAEDLSRALTLADEGDCDQAEAAWRLARLHLPRAEDWIADHEAEAAAAIAPCLVAQAASKADAHDAVPLLERARSWDHRLPALWEVAVTVGDRLMKEGQSARMDKDWRAAYAAFDGAVRANPSLSWARRYAEEARDLRLGIDPETEAAAKDAKEAQVRERAAEAEAARAGRPAQGDEEEPDGEAAEAP